LVNFNVAQGQGCCGGNPNARQQWIVTELDHTAAREMKKRRSAGALVVTLT